MNRKESLILRLDEAFMSSRFHSFLGSLGGVTDEYARWIPPNYKGFRHMDGSILNLAYHCGGDKHILMSTAFGDGSVTWLDVESMFRNLGGNMNAARDLAVDGHAKVLSVLGSVGEDDLNLARPYYGGKTLSAYEVFSIVAEHDLYHAGQINYVRNLIGGGAAG